jgi:hypothetical protein
VEAAQDGQGWAGLSRSIWENLLNFPAMSVRIRVTYPGLMYAAIARLRRMAEPTRASEDSTDEKVDRAVSDYVNGLSDEHRMLIALKAQLYGGSWRPMLDDLQNRLAGEPYIIKLATRIQDDIERIEQMQRFEAEHSIDLADCVELL